MRQIFVAAIAGTVLSLSASMALAQTAPAKVADTELGKTSMGRGWRKNRLPRQKQPAARRLPRFSSPGRRSTPRSPQWPAQKRG